MVLTDFVFALAKFALYFFYLLFNCQVSIAHLFYVSLSIISPSNPFVNSFLKIFSIFLSPFGVSQVCQRFFAPTHKLYHFVLRLSIGFLKKVEKISSCFSHKIKQQNLSCKMPLFRTILFFFKKYKARFVLEYTRFVLNDSSI